MKNTCEMKLALRALACLLAALVSITSSIYTRFLYTFSHMPFLIFLPSTSASFSVNRLSAAMASNNSDIIYDTMNSKDLKITEVVKE